VISSCCSWAVALPWSIFSSDIFKGAERFRSRYGFQRYRKIEAFHFGADLLISQITPNYAGLCQVKCKTKSRLVCRFCDFLGCGLLAAPGEVPEESRHQFDKPTGGDGGDPGGPQTPHFVDTRCYGYWSLASAAEPFRQETNIKRWLWRLSANGVEVRASGPRKNHIG
jgi:hypothetical protein